MKNEKICYRIRHKETKQYVASHSGKKTIWIRKPNLDNINFLSKDKNDFEIVKFELNELEVC